MAEKKPAWALHEKDLVEQLKSSEKGLTDDEAKKRLAEYGPNEVAEKGRRYALDIFISQLKNPLVFVLIIAAVISFFVGEDVDAGVILAIVFLNAVLGFFQEYRAEQALQELKKYVTLKAKVFRGGRIVEVDARELVPGDIVYLNIGDVIPADLRLLFVDELATNESSLTGESMPVEKRTAVVGGEYTLPYQLSNMAFMGTVVSEGYGHGIVVATGKNTFFGKAAGYLKQAPLESDFQKNIRGFGNFTLKIIAIMTLFIFVANAILGKGLLSSFIFAIALAVGITPEVLPIIMTITLSNGALKMAKEKVIVKRLASVEDFGNMDTLCCDKTGTLTVGEPALRDYVTINGEREERILLYGLLCNSAKEKGTVASGNPIDRAIWQSDGVHKLEPKLHDYKIVDENEFDFTRRRMSVVAKSGEGNILIVKGAPDAIFEACNSVGEGDKRKVISKEIKLRLKEKVDGYEEEGYRVIAVAEKPTKKTDTSKTDEFELTFVGFLLFLDPVKKTVPEALETLKKLGVAIKIISGDSPKVTRKICEEAGIEIAENRVVSGEELEKLDEDQFHRYCRKYTIFARVSPEQKYKIVASLNREGHVVGFLGDGINDAPALNEADVGISVDSGAGIAKDAADVILLQKSLRVLAQGIIEGRKTFANITKYILNTISANYGNMFTVAISSLFLKFIPLLPSQILLNNLLSDVPMLTIATDNVDQESLAKPKKWNIKMISQFMVYFGTISVLFDLALILPLIFLFKVPTELFRTAWFVESVLSEIIVTFSIRTQLPFWKSLPSKLLLGAGVFMIIISFVLPYTVLGEAVFEFVRMPGRIVSLIMGVLIAYFITVEITKYFFFSSQAGKAY